MKKKMERIIDFKPTDEEKRELRAKFGKTALNRAHRTEWWDRFWSTASTIADCALVAVYAIPLLPILLPLFIILGVLFWWEHYWTDRRKERDAIVSHLKRVQE
jgi:hypothetical protein